MRLDDLHALPKVRDSWSYLYVERCTIDQEQKSIAIHDAHGRTPVPCASLTLLMLGPGTRITHAAISTLADNGCLVAWTGEQGVRYYASGMGETRSAARLLRQASLTCDPSSRLMVVRRMYQMRFAERIPEGWALEQIRGREGVRVREAYARASREYDVPWMGRSYKRGDWRAADPVNRALSAANSCLYGVCHAAIVSAGWSPALGFIHTGKMLSFVYDVADLYKTEITVPAAFRAAATLDDDENTSGLESMVRHQCRDTFHESRLLKRLVGDLHDLLEVPEEDDDGEGPDADPAQPGGLWDPSGVVDGGTNHGDGAGWW